MMKRLKGHDKIAIHLVQGTTSQWSQRSYNKVMNTSYQTHLSRKHLIWCYICRQ